MEAAKYQYISSARVEIGPNDKITAKARAIFFLMSPLYRCVPRGHSIEFSLEVDSYDSAFSRNQWLIFPILRGLGGCYQLFDPADCVNTPLSPSQGGLLIANPFI